MILAAAGSSPSVTWYLTRATGAVSLLLLTGALVLGVVDVRRLNSSRWPRFVLDSLHRNIALLAVSFLMVHVLMAVLDSFTSISLVDVVVPFAGSYRPFWLGLGALAFDLMLAVTLTSIARRRLGHSTWRYVHWLSYASWPVALLHGLGTGSDAKTGWMLVLVAACFVSVLGALALRLGGSWRVHPQATRLTLGTAGAFSLFLAIWLPGGPLGSEWARRSGTPAQLLQHSSPPAKDSGAHRARHH